MQLEGLSGSQGCIDPQGDCSACAVPRNFCSRERIPHCGSDGVTYASECLFRNPICSSFKLSLYRAFEC
uniref:Kazal-like domain-containing protein n=1 Tax=Gallus gallus TaxID=9031 RepID=A0A8V0YII4_CHICK